MTDINHYLQAINNNSDSLRTLYFRPPGIFTNALISKPDITSLLRDADTHENALYQVDNTGKPERKDGTRGVVDTLNEDFEAYELEQQQLQNEEITAQETLLPTRPAVVPIPKDTKQPPNDLNKGVKNLLSRFNEENHDYDVDILCETVRQLVEKYPIKEIEEDLGRYIEQWQGLNRKIMQQEETIETQRRQLSQFNVSLNERDHTASSWTNESQENIIRTRTAAELIVEEEEELRQLELELERKTRETEALVEASKR